SSYIAGNTGVGGVSCSFCLDVSISRSTIVDNHAEFGWGGGVTIISGIPFGDERQDILFKEVLIKGNSAPDGGGGLAVIDGEDVGEADTPPRVVIKNATFKKNFTAAGSDGGGVIALVGDLTVYKSLFSHNTAGLPDELSQAEGGAIFFAGRELDLLTTTFKGNAAEYHGGAVRLQSEAPAVFDQVIAKGNRAAGGAGGAVYITGAPTGVFASSFYGNW